MANTIAVCLFLWLAAAGLHIALHQPVFHPLDEAYHFDHCLKLARAQRPSVLSSLEPELLALMRERLPNNLQHYRGSASDTPAAHADLITTSYQSYHPPLFYTLGAGLSRLGRLFGLGLLGQILALRCLCALLAAGGRLMVYLALRRMHPAVALAALPYLLFMVPVDLLRVSNDALVYFLGSLLFWLLIKFRDAGTDPAAARFLKLIAALLAAAVFTKTTALLFLLPATLLVLLVIQLERSGFRQSGSVTGIPALLTGANLRLVAGVLLPALLVQGALIVSSKLAGQGLSGTGHLVTAQFPQPLGFHWGILLPTAESWLRWHDLLLLNETPLNGKQGWQLYPSSRLVTFEQLGLMFSLGWMIFANPRTLPWRRDGQPWPLHVWLLAGWLFLIFMHVLTNVLMARVGRVYWASRQYLPVEFLTVWPAAAGWALVMERLNGRCGLLIKTTLWLAAASWFGWASWPYL